VFRHYGRHCRCLELEEPKCKAKLSNCVRPKDEPKCIAYYLPINKKVEHSLDIAKIFKDEYSNLVAVLCHYYNVQDIQQAEDIVSDTFVKAMKTWSHKGIPDSPKAWLRKSAKNILIDQHRRVKTFEKIVPKLTLEKSETSETEISDQIIEDSQLRMIFHVCDPQLKKDAQLCLSLRILCGFSIEEIAKALLSNKEAINKKLYRAKKTLREEDNFEFTLDQESYLSRLDIVLRVIYLIFNEGYYSSVSEENIKHEICYEAMHLCKFLENQSKFPKSKIQALMALMCFHSSRLNARTNDSKVSRLYHEQDKSQWNKQLILKGEEYLNRSAIGDVVSKYHLEAAIAYWHTTEDNTKWNNILQLYNKLLTIEYSPIIAMNRTYVLAKANSVKEAIGEALKLDLSGNHYYYCLLAELYRMNNDLPKEKSFLDKALLFAVKENEKELILSKLKKQCYKE